MVQLLKTQALLATMPSTLFGLDITFWSRHLNLAAIRQTRTHEWLGDEIEDIQLALCAKLAFGMITLCINLSSYRTFKPDEMAYPPSAVCLHQLLELNLPLLNLKEACEHSPPRISLCLLNRHERYLNGDRPANACGRPSDFLLPAFF